MAEHTAGIIGVLGGMGPAATADFYAKLVRATPASTDQDHLRVLIWSDPSIPDRTAALLGGGADPVPLLTDGATRLRSAGAAFLVVPCNTAHAFLPRVRERVDVSFLSMIEATATRIAGESASVARVGLLGTTATVQSGLYREELDRYGLELVAPTPTAQARVMAGIARVKAGAIDAEAWRLVSEAATALADAGAELIIAGCTELPLALAWHETGLPLIDPTQVLAEEAVRRVLRAPAAVASH